MADKEDTQVTSLPDNLLEVTVGAIGKPKSAAQYVPFVQFKDKTNGYMASGLPVILPNGKAGRMSITIKEA